MGLREGLSVQIHYRFCTGNPTEKSQTCALSKREKIASVSSCHEIFHIYNLQSESLSYFYILYKLEKCKVLTFVQLKLVLYFIIIGFITILVKLSIIDMIFVSISMGYRKS